MTQIKSDIVQKLETAADVFMSPPDKVNETDRKCAENVFIELRNSKIGLGFLELVFAESENQFAIFETVKSVREATLRQWAILDSEIIKAIWQLLLQYAVKNAGVSSWLLGEILQSVAVIHKRGTFDQKMGNLLDYFSTLDSLIQSGQPRLQGIACLALETVCTEYASSWRTGDVGITWDFHIRSKRCFEAIGLKKALEIALIVLQSGLKDITTAGIASDPNLAQLCDRFLAVAECVLCWNFGSMLLPRRLIFAMEFGGSSALRPPESWRNVFLNDNENNVLNFFFQVHSVVRHNEQLCHRSMQCLVQLASLMGEVFPTEGTGIPATRGPSQASTEKYQNQNEYIRNFVENVLHVFSGNNGPMSYEVYSVCVMISKLFTYHPLPTFVRLPKEILEPFLQFMLLIGSQLCVEAVSESLSPDVDDSTRYHESLALILNAWAILLRAEGRFLPEGTFRYYNWQLVTAFVKAVLAPPFGSRPILPKTTTTTVESEEDEEEDRDLFADLLSPIGLLARNCIDQFMPFITSALTERICQFLSKGHSRTGPLPVWQEDMHWICLLIGFTLTSEDGDLSCHVQPEIYDYSSDFMKKISSKFGQNFENPKSTMDDFVLKAIQSFDRQLNYSGEKEQNLDPCFRLNCHVLHWAAIEIGLISNEQDFLLFASPQLTSTTLWLCRRLICAFTSPQRDTDIDVDLSIHLNLNDDNKKQTDDDIPLPKFDTGTEVSQKLTDFLLRKCFLCLRKFPGERRVTADATNLLVSMVDSGGQRAMEVSRSENLLAELSSLNMEKLSSFGRRELFRALLLIGVGARDESIRAQMYRMILEPLQNRFVQFCCVSKSQLNAAQWPANLESDLLDILDCFLGIARATQLHSAEFLFNYLNPTLRLCIRLLIEWREIQTVTDAILRLFCEIARRLAIYLDSPINSQSLYQCLLDLLNVYAQNQAGKYRLIRDFDSEDQASDLLLIMDILTHVLSKDILLLSDSSEPVESGSKVALAGLETIAPLIKVDLLKFPALALKFYRLLLYFTEMYPECICEMSPPMLDCLFRSIASGLSSEYGNEVCQVSLEIIGQMATFVADQISLCCSENMKWHISDASPRVAQFRRALVDFLKPSFEACLMHSCQVDVFGDASAALFALICCDRNAYNDMVSEIIASHTDEDVRGKLANAFGALLPASRSISATRKEKREFRDRFETFLNDIQGLLCMNR